MLWTTLCEATHTHAVLGCNMIGQVLTTRFGSVITLGIRHPRKKERKKVLRDSSYAHNLLCQVIKLGLRPPRKKNKDHLFPRNTPRYT